MNKHAKKMTYFQEKYYFVMTQVSLNVVVVLRNKYDLAGAK